MILYERGLWHRDVVSDFASLKNCCVAGHVQTSSEEFGTASSSYISMKRFLSEENLC